MSAQILRFKKLQAALGSRLSAQSLQVEGNHLRVSVASAEHLALAMQVTLAQGLTPGEDVLLGLEAFDSVLSVDTHSCLCEAGANLPLQVLEARLKSSGLTFGPLTPQVQRLRVGEWLEGPHGSLRPVAGGRLEPAALALEAALWDGTVYRSHRSPRSASGPDLDHLLLGGGGRVGRITRATLRALPRPTTRATRSFQVADGAAVVRILQRSLAQEAVPTKAALWRLGEHLTLSIQLDGLAFRVSRDATRLSRIAAELKLTEVAPAEVPELQQPKELEVTWSSLGEALDRMGGAVVELHRIARESVVAVSDRPLDGAGVLDLSANAPPPPWFASLVDQARETR